MYKFYDKVLWFRFLGLNIDNNYRLINVLVGSNVQWLIEKLKIEFRSEVISNNRLK